MFEKFFKWATATKVEGQKDHFGSYAEMKKELIGPEDVAMATPQPPSFTTTCQVCGVQVEVGYIRHETTVVVYTTNLGEVRVFTEVREVCKHCAAQTDQLILQLRGGRDLQVTKDVQRFMFSQGFIQPFKEEEGDMLIISTDEWNQGHCPECGVELDERTCDRCDPKEPNEDAAPKRRRS